MEPYRQAIADLSLSLERGTARVPGDGYYYIVLRGEVQGRFRTLRQAQVKYKELVATTGYKPKPNERPKRTPAEQAVERYMDELEAYWGSSHKHARRGGKTMYRS